MQIGCASEVVELLCLIWSQDGATGFHFQLRVREPSRRGASCSGYRSASLLIFKPDVAIPQRKNMHKERGQVGSGVRDRRAHDPNMKRFCAGSTGRNLNAPLRKQLNAKGMRTRKAAMYMVCQRPKQRIARLESHSFCLPDWLVSSPGLAMTIMTSLLTARLNHLHPR